MEHTKPTRPRKPRMQTISFELRVDGKSYEVSATPFTIASGDLLYRVSYNQSPVHVFAWDEGLNRFAETDVLADVIPPVIEMSIARKLSEYAHEMQVAA